MNDIKRQFEANPYAGYTYSYPHKTAYRKFDSPLLLPPIWEKENQESLFLYLHIPFCEFRCGFCNLFTHALPKLELLDRYLKQVEQHAKIIREMMPQANFSRVAIGGGTPTYLSVKQLERIFLILTETLGVKPSEVPIACEASPATLDNEKLKLLKDFGVNRISMGVQSVDPRDLKKLGRPQAAIATSKMIEQINSFDFNTMNLDLIYGGAEQTENSWMYSIEEIIKHKPEEVFLYPLYVRELTGLGRTSKNHSDTLKSDKRMALYELARDRLRDAGYDRISLRMFRQTKAGTSDELTYSCQTDGMVGLGSGGRSYTNELHYSTEWAVGRSSILNLINDYIDRSEIEFTTAWNGLLLDSKERKRRFVLMSILQQNGMKLSDYTQQFDSNAMDDFPELQQLIDAEFLESNTQQVRPTEIGLDYSDAIGPWLYSKNIKELMASYVYH